MIRITCTHCRQVLTIDDGFAGGVCRCQHCGTIQTVPAIEGKSQGRGAVPAAVTAKTLYRSHPGGPRKPGDHHGDDHHHGSGSGLDELAEIVSSSGLGSNSRRLRARFTGSGLPDSALPPKSPARRKGSLIAAITGGAVIVVALIAYLAIRHAMTGQPPAAPVNPPPVSNAPVSNSPVSNAPVSNEPAHATAAIPYPNFCDMDLQAQDTVIYLLDDGSSAGDILPAVQSATYQSIKSLGNDRRFKVIFWREGSPTYPTEGTIRATSEEEAKCEAALRDAYGQGTTDVDEALKLALTSQPDAVVLVTAKAAQLSEDFAQVVLDIRGDSHVRIYTVGVNGDSTIDATKPGVLATIAVKTGGQFLNISSADLNRSAH